MFFRLFFRFEGQDNMKKTLLIKDFWPYEDNGTHDAFVEDLGWD